MADSSTSTTQVRVEIPTSLHKQLRVWGIERNKTMAETLTELLSRALADGEDTDEQG